LLYANFKKCDLILIPLANLYQFQLIAFTLMQIACWSNRRGEEGGMDIDIEKPHVTMKEAACRFFKKFKLQIVPKISQLPGHGPVPGPGINYIGPLSYKKGIYQAVVSEREPLI
jgi:hypothetical protein